MSTTEQRHMELVTSKSQQLADKLNAGVRFALSTNPLNITESAMRIHAQIILFNEIRSPVSDEVRDRFVHIYGTTPALLLKKRLGALYKRTLRCPVCGKASFSAMAEDGIGFCIGNG